MTRYKVVYEQNDNPEVGVYGISIVDSPANKMELIALSNIKESKILLQAENKVQQTLTGVVLIPNQVISRVNPVTKEQYEIVFPEETIVNLSRDFMKKGYQNMSTYNHDDDKWLEGVTVVESWLISHETLDKAFALGFKDLPIGTWMITMKLSDENWKQYVETGLVKGFSIDSYVPMEKITMQTEELSSESKLKNNLKNTTMNVILELSKLLKQHAIRLATVEVEGVMYYADAFEVGNMVHMEQDGEMLPVKDVTFDYEGYTFTTDAEGIIVTKVEKEQPEMEVEVNMQSEQLGKFEGEGGVVVFAEWLTLGKTLFNENQEPLTNFTFEFEGKLYLTNDIAEIIKIEKNETSPFWKVKMTEVSDETVSTIEDVTDELTNEVKKPLEEVDVEALKARIAELEAQLENIMKEKEAVLEENVALKSQPVGTRLRAVIENKKITESPLEALSRIAKQSK